jgi:sterol desaturase/sphingolipid hydroxylase (fatty acid hydroxylase superfamily)
MITIILLVFVGCFVLERVLPGWPLPRVRTWPVRVLLINAAQLAVVLLAGWSWERWLSSWSLLRLSDDMSPAMGGMLAYFIATFVFYWWHRWRHESDLLWRLFHQIHHSPQRLEVITSFYKHPAEMVVNSLLGSLLVYTLLGLSLEAGAVYTLCTALGEFFYHTNVRTPRWIGLVFQRPEMHRIHHRHGRHKNNYGDITWWDMLFGTYENPAEWRHHCGFDDAKEQRLADMLLWRDVHASSGKRKPVAAPPAIDGQDQSAPK